MNGYRLLLAQVPAYPNTKSWVDALRWCLAVMDASDGDLAFAAGLLRHVVEYGPLSEKQVKYAQRLLNRLIAMWEEKRLACQQEPDLTNVVALTRTAKSGDAA